MTKKIELTRGQSCIIDEEDFEFVARWKWKALSSGHKFYAARTGSKNGHKHVTHLLHRELLGAVAGEEVDHINGDTLDNRRRNLRKCSRLQNCMNRETTSKQGYKGLTLWTDGKYTYYQCRIKLNGKTKSLGYFKDKEEAARAYDKAAKELFGEFAKLNFTDE